jgi:hypothetical protein
MSPLVPLAAACICLVSFMNACDSVPDARTSPTASPSSPASRAALRACDVYDEAWVWDSRDVDTDNDGEADFTQVFPASGSRAQVARIAAEARVARRDTRLAQLGAAVDFLVSVYDSPNVERPDVLEAEDGMTRACDAVRRR